MSRIRCERCARPASHCLCALIPSLPSRTRVLVLQHPSEVGHALNTAGLAVLGLRNAELRVGERFAEETWRVPGYRARCRPSRQSPRRSTNWRRRVPTKPC